eukprot:TRINITY_DN1036_c0_g1_i3.p1 TRINITY_DN1036_c0_g1~~TRINITY_DN1036_c0_g1_i3.p1  ORF type:complete len:132 (-),score=39.08 TRINITY_DN1036_c0_g1_i3:248-643(-)
MNEIEPIPLTPLSFPENTSDKIDKLRDDIMDQHLKIKITDGRYFIGILKCVDQQKNVILFNSIEIRPVRVIENPIALNIDEEAKSFANEGHLKRLQEDAKQGIERINHASLTLIPGEYIVSIELGKETASE